MSALLDFRRDDAGRSNLTTGFTRIPGTPELSAHCPGETRDVYLRGGWSTIVNLLGRDSSPDARSNPMSKRPLFTTFAVKWVSADNGYYVKKSVFIEVTVVPV